ncbi:MAG: hypothetical protein ABI407_15825 [Bradyrhizobium sp.]
MLNIDHTHSRAIYMEIGESMLPDHPELPASIGRQLDRLRELDEESSIVPPMDAATRW